MIMDIIKEVMLEHSLGILLAISTLCSVIVFVALMVELCAGWYKAKLRKEEHTSEDLARTVMKFITREGSLMIACGVDIMIHFSRIWHIVDVKILDSVPMATIIWAIFLCGIEWMSVKEKAEDKAKKRINDATRLGLELAEEILASRGVKIDLNRDGRTGKEIEQKG